ncbi:MAG: ribonuclease HI family protein [Phycisphaeraceae bacterium]|nr:ribonuclease HI family protein [Phycisphaeraceae bacterium]
MTLVIHVDGGSRGNPGPAAVGVTIRDQDTGKVLHEAGYFLGRTTNNVAEYRGLLKALEIARTILAASSVSSGGVIHIRSDSQLMVRQVLGEYRVKSADLQPLYAEVMQTLADLDATYGSGRPRGAWQIEHVRREFNARADELVNQCLDMGEDVIVTDALSAEGTTKPIKKTPHPPAQDWLEVVPTPGITKSTCPADAPDGQRWTLAPAAPQGLCLHALAVAVLAGWRPGTGGQAAGQGPCKHCGRTIRWG